MRAILLLSALAGLSVTLAACGAAPKPGDARAAAYQADYDTCDGSVPDAVTKRNAKTGLSWFASPVTRWGQISEGMSSCLQAKGWGRSRACTAAELRAGDRSPNLRVTSAGVVCTDPATRGQERG